MRFLCDQDVWAVTVRFLRDLRHDVTTAAEAEISRASDAALLEAAQKQSSALVTRDRDFGGLVFAKSAGAGVLYLRMTPMVVQAVHTELQRVLSLYSEDEILASFIVIEPGRHRRRHIV